MLYSILSILVYVCFVILCCNITLVLLRLISLFLSFPASTDGHNSTVGSQSHSSLSCNPAGQHYILHIIVLMQVAVVVSQSCSENPIISDRAILESQPRRNSHMNGYRLLWKVIGFFLWKRTQFLGKSLPSYCDENICFYIIRNGKYDPLDVHENCIIILFNTSLRATLFMDENLETITANIGAFLWESNTPPPASKP